MHKTSLIQTLLTLTIEERQRFIQFISLQPIQNQEEVQKFTEILLSFGQEFEHPNFTKAYIFAQLYPDQPLNDKKIRVIMSRAFQALCHFLAFLEFEKQPFLTDRLVLTQLRERRCEKVFQKQFNALNKKLETQPKRDAEYDLSQFHLATEANGFYGQQQIRVMNDSIQAKINHLDAWYLSNKLKESCEMLNREKVFATSYKNPLIEELIAILNVPGHPFEDIPAIKIYHKIYLCLTDPNSAHYFELVELLKEMYQLFPGEEARGMFKHAQNYCIRRVNRGEAIYYQELFRLYQFQLKHEISLELGHLAHTDYKNIVTVGLRLKEFEWVEAFIHSAKDKLIPTYQENVFNFSLASFYFETNQGSSAIKLLQSVKFTDVFYEISARQLLLKIYYETGEIEGAVYQIQSFAVFLRRNKNISAQNRSTHLNFLKLAKRLVNLKDREELLSKNDLDKRVKKLQDQIQSAKQTANLAWLKAKINEFES